MAKAAGIVGGGAVRHQGMVRFASVEALISTERACIWTLGGMLDARQFGQLSNAAHAALEPFVTAEGEVAFELPALILTARRGG